MIFDPMMYLKVFLVGGLICLIGQILIITTKMTSARILVTFLLSGVFLHVIGVFEPLKEFAGSGVTIPIMGFGYLLAKGAIEGWYDYGLIGLLTGGLTATSAGIAAAVVSAFVFSLLFSSKTKK